MTLQQQLHASNALDTIWSDAQQHRYEAEVWAAVYHAQAHWRDDDGQPFFGWMEGGPSRAELPEWPVDLPTATDAAAHGLMRRLDNARRCLATTGADSTAVHVGLASSDVVNLRYQMQTRDTIAHLDSRLTDVRIALAALVARAERAAGWYAGRTHGEPAQPVSAVRRVVAAVGPVADAALVWARRASHQQTVWHGFVGATGAGAELWPAGAEQLASQVADRLGLVLQREVSVQHGPVGQRLHVELAGCGTGLALAFGNLARQVRLWHLDAFVSTAQDQLTGQRGTSTSMPHKQSGWQWERLDALARIAAAHGSALRDALAGGHGWLEGDIALFTARQHHAVGLWYALDGICGQLPLLLDRLQIVDAPYTELGAAPSALFSSVWATWLVRRGRARDSGEARRFVQAALERDETPPADVVVHLERALAADAGWVAGRWRQQLAQWSAVATVDSR